MVFFCSLQLCIPCHKDCLTCLGSGEFSCKECRKYKYHSKCVNECPKNFYDDDENKTCQECHPECMNGCSGPLSSECYACRNFKIPFNHNQTVVSYTVANFILFLFFAVLVPPSSWFPGLRNPFPVILSAQRKYLFDCSGVQIDIL